MSAEKIGNGATLDGNKPLQSKKSRNIKSCTPHIVNGSGIDNASGILLQKRNVKVSTSAPKIFVEKNEQEKDKLFSDMLNVISGRNSYISSTFAEMSKWINSELPAEQNDLIISMALAPKILAAVKNGWITPESIQELYRTFLDKFSDEKPPSYLSNTIDRLRDLASTPDALRTFNEHVNDYLQQMNQAQDENLRQNYMKKALSFIYNVIAFPHQRKGEGSCYASAVATKLYKDKKIEYMAFMREIIDKETVNFGLLGNNEIKPITVTAFGNWCDDLDKAYQKLISAIAVACPQLVETATKELKSQIQKICEKLGKETASTISINLLKPGVVWNHSWIPAVCSLNDMVQTRARLLKNIVSIIKKSLKQSIGGNFINEIAKEILDNVHDAGGNTEQVIATLSNEEDNFNMQFKNGNLVKNSIFDLKTMQEIVNELEYGTTHIHTKYRIHPGQYIVSTFTKNDGAGHAFTFLSGHYDIGSMAVGDRMKVGHMNYGDSQSQDSYIYLEKIDDEHFQLKSRGSPIAETIRELHFYTKFAIEYDNISKNIPPTE